MEAIKEIKFTLEKGAKRVWARKSMAIETKRESDEY